MLCFENWNVKIFIKYWCFEFDSIYGFPSYIYFDISEMIADDEIGYTITNFIPTK